MSKKNLEQTSDILRVLYPSYIFCFILGFAPIHIQRNAYSVKIVFMKVYDWITTLVYTFILMGFVYIHFYTISYKMLNTAVELFITHLYFVIIAGSVFANVIFHKMNKKSIVKLYEKIYEVDNEIKLIGIRLDYKLLTWQTTRFTYVGLGFFTTYMGFLAFSQEYDDKLHSFLIYAMLYLAVLSFVSVACVFVGMYRCIVHMFQKVLDHVNSVILEDSEKFQIYYKCEMLTKISIVHQKLCELSRFTNSVTSMQMLVSFTVTFLLTTVQAYSIACTFQNQTKYLKYAIASCVCIFIFMYEKFIITLISFKSMNMISKTNDLLIKILNNYSTAKKITKEVNAFGLQILHERFAITAGNFFRIDLSLLITMCSATVTYIMLLIQTESDVDMYEMMRNSLGVA